VDQLCPSTSSTSATDIATSSQRSSGTRRQSIMQTKEPSIVRMASMPTFAARSKLLEQRRQASGLFDFFVEDINLAIVDLSRFRNKVCLIVNVASD